MLFNDTYKTVSRISEGVFSDKGSKFIKSLYQISFGHLHMNDVMKIIKDEEIKIQNQVNDNTCSIQIEIRQGSQERILGRFGQVDSMIIKYISAP